MEDKITPYEEFGIECGNGWKPLLKPIFDYIEEYNKSHEDKITIFQIKEKFGGLRVYVDGATLELHNLIENAEYLAEDTCEICGSTKNVGKKAGWITTCCIECAKNIAKNRNQTIRWIPNNLTKPYKWFEISPDGEVKKIESSK